MKTFKDKWRRTEKERNKEKERKEEMLRPEKKRTERRNRSAGDQIVVVTWSSSNTTVWHRTSGTLDPETLIPLAGKQLFITVLVTPLGLLHCIAPQDE